MYSEPLTRTGPGVPQQHPPKEHDNNGELIHLEEHSLGKRETKRLARVSVELDVDRVGGESSRAVPS